MKFIQGDSYMMHGIEWLQRTVYKVEKRVWGDCPKTRMSLH